MDKRYFSDKLAKWYKKNQRELPWRKTKDPYKIWLSEIILQQTRVSQGLPYYLKFVEKYPHVKALACAPEEEVLRLWQGLGYYTRARNLHRCAKTIVNDHQAKFPDTFDGLKKLPGIGEYTAAAIASISYKEPVAVVDGNVFRVLSRVFGLDIPINSSEGKRVFSTLANELIPKKTPDEHNQAVMEFGALQCTPRNPECHICSLKPACFAANHGMQHQLPVKVKAKKARNRYFYYIVFRSGNSLLMKKREEKDIWSGLYDFYLIEKKRLISPAKLLLEINSTLKMNVQVHQLEVSPPYKHVLSHQIIQSKFLIVSLGKSDHLIAGKEKFYSLKQIGVLPKPVLISRFLEDYQLL